MANEIESTSCIVGPCRFSYAKVHHPEKTTGDDGVEKEQYSLALLIPKKDKESIAKINACIEAAKAVAKDKKWGGKIPSSATLKLPLRDGDDKEGEEYEGMMFLNAKSNQKPQILKLEKGIKKELEDENEVYSGCWGYVSLNFYGFKAKGNVGVGVALNNILKTKDDEPLAASRKSAFDDFKDFGEGDFKGIGADEESGESWM